MTKRGWPAKLTVLRQEEFCESLDAGLTRSAAGRLLGCAPSTIIKALERAPAFRKHVRQTERAAALNQSEKRALLTPPRAAAGTASSAEHPQRQTYIDEQSRAAVLLRRRLLNL